MSARGVPSSGDAMSQWISEMSKFKRDVERGRYRGSGASYGLPFTLGAKWRIEEDGDGNLVVTNLDAGTSTIVASDFGSDEE